MDLNCNFICRLSRHCRCLWILEFYFSIKKSTRQEFIRKLNPLITHIHKAWKNDKKICDVIWFIEAIVGIFSELFLSFSTQFRFPNPICIPRLVTKLYVLWCLFSYVFLCFYLLPMFAWISISYLPSLASMDQIMSHLHCYPLWSTFDTGVIQTQHCLHLCAMVKT